MESSSPSRLQRLTAPIGLIVVAIAAACVGLVLLWSTSDAPPAENDNTAVEVVQEERLATDARSLSLLTVGQTQTFIDLDAAVFFERLEEVPCSSCDTPVYHAIVAVTQDTEGQTDRVESVRFTGFPSNHLVGDLAIQALELTPDQELRLFVRKRQ